MEKVTVLALVAAFVLIVGAVFAAADFLGEEPEVSEATDSADPAPKACGAGNDCGAGCGGSCGGSCGVPTCGCGR